MQIAATLSEVMAEAALTGFSSICSQSQDRRMLLSVGVCSIMARCALSSQYWHGLLCYDHAVSCDPANSVAVKHQDFAGSQLLDCSPLLSGTLWLMYPSSESLSS